MTEFLAKTMFFTNTQINQLIQAIYAYDIYRCTKRFEKATRLVDDDWPINSKVCVCAWSVFRGNKTMGATQRCQNRSYGTSASTSWILRMRTRKTTDFSVADAVENTPRFDQKIDKSDAIALKRDRERESSKTDPGQS